MAYDNIVDPLPYLSEREVSSLTGVSQEVPLLQRIELSPAISFWAYDISQTSGENVIPRNQYKVEKDGKEHAVAWVRRVGRVSVGGCEEDVDYCQLVCDCAAEALNEEVLEEKMFACSAVAHAIKARSFIIRERLQNRDVFGDYSDNLEIRTRLSLNVNKYVARFLLNYESVHPETWFANLSSGQHLVTGLASILEQDRSFMLKVIRSMEKENLVELHAGEVVTLKETA